VVRPDPVVITSATGATTITWKDPTPANTATFDTTTNKWIIDYGVDSQGIPTANIGTTKVRQTSTGLSLVAGIVTEEPVSNPKNEIGFIVMEAASGTTTYTEKARVMANATSWSGADSTKDYQVLAYNAAGNSTSVKIAQEKVIETATTITTNSPTATIAPTVLTGVLQAPKTVVPTGTTGTSVAWTPVTGANGYNVYVGGVLVQTVDATTNSTTLAAAPANGAAVTVAAAVSGATPASPVDFVVANAANVGNNKTSASVTLTWANNPSNLNNVSGLTLTWGQGNATTSKTFAANDTGVTLIGLANDKNYTFKLVANGTGAISSAVSKTLLTAQ
jgi:hypothetical protein